MRKLVALVVVLAMVLSSMSFAFAAAPSDTAGNKYESSILKLIGLGIINGYTDGTYKPANNVTRAEFAKLMCVALGYEEAAKGAKNNAVFADVPVTHWASGYVAVAYQNEIIKGVGNGNFNPEAAVTYEQVVTIIMRALGKGYDKMADTMGGYPVGYLSIASQKEITKGSDGVPGTPATRALVAKLIDNSLDKKWMNMQASKITSDGKVEYEFSLSEDSILTKGLHLGEYTAIVDSVDAAKSKVTFTTDIDGKKVYEAVSPISVVGLTNCYVKLWEKDGKIYALENKTTVKFDKLEKINGTDSPSSTDVDGEGIADLTKIQLKNDGGIYYPLLDDDKDVDVDVKADFDDLSDDLATLVGDFAKVYINDDNKVYRFEAFNLDEDGIISAVDSSSIKYQTLDTNDKKISDLDDADDLVVAIDGVEKSLSDLKADMYFNSFSNNDGTKVFVVATTGKATGKLDSYKTDKIKIGGTTYDLSRDNKSTQFVSYNEGKNYDETDLADLGDIEVVGYKDQIGKIAYVKGKATSSTSDFVALTKKVKVESETITVVKDVDGTSTEVTYNVDTDDVNDQNETGAITWGAFQVAVFGGASGATGQVTSTDTRDLIYKFFIDSDNKVTDIVPLSWVRNDVTPATFDKDEDFVTFSGADGNGVSTYYVDAAKFFNVYDTSDADYDMKALYWSELEGKTPAGSVDIAVDSSKKDKMLAMAWNDNYDVMNADDVFYGYVKDERRVGSYYEMTLATSTGDVEVKLHKDDVDSNEFMTDAEKAFIVYEKVGSTGNRIKIRTLRTVVGNGNTTAPSIVQDGTTSFGAINADLRAVQTGNVTDIDDGYITLNGGTAFNVASNAVIVKITLEDDATDIDAAKVSSLSAISEHASIDASADDVVMYRSVTDGKVHFIYYFND